MTRLAVWKARKDILGCPVRASWRMPDTLKYRTPDDLPERAWEEMRENVISRLVPDKEMRPKMTVSAKAWLTLHGDIEKIVTLPEGGEA